MLLDRVDLICLYNMPGYPISWGEASLLFYMPYFTAFRVNAVSNMWVPHYPVSHRLGPLCTAEPSRSIPGSPEFLPEMTRGPVLTPGFLSGEMDGAGGGTAPASHCQPMGWELEVGSPRPTQSAV